MTIEKLYDSTIAEHYGAVTATALEPMHDLCLQQIANFLPADRSYRIVESSVGTGEFLAKFIHYIEDQNSGTDLDIIGFDVSRAMLDQAKQKVAFNGHVLPFQRAIEILDTQTVDLICAHYVLSYVPLKELTHTASRLLKKGGLISIASTLFDPSYPAMKRLHSSPIATLIGANKTPMRDLVNIPGDRTLLENELHDLGFEVLKSEEIPKDYSFASLKDYLVWAYYGGWATHAIDALGVRPNMLSRWIHFICNRLYFPIEESQTHLCLLARKVA